MLQLQGTFWGVARKEWPYWMGLGLLSMLIAHLMLFPSERSFEALYSVPLAFSGDSLAFQINIERVLEHGWFLDSARQGYLFDANLADYPTSDAVNYAVMWLLVHMGGTVPFAFNMYILLGFFLAAASAYIVSRIIGLPRSWSIFVGILYAFIPFHFMRLGHLFFTWYYVATLYLYYALRIFTNDLPILGVWKKNKNLVQSAENQGQQSKSVEPVTLAKLAFLDVIGLVFLACTGLYFAVFACVTFTLCAFASWIGQLRIRPVLASLACIIVLVATVFVATTPTRWHKQAHGTSPHAADRMAAESEVYGLKITQMLLPSMLHRNHTLRQVSLKYKDTFPFVNENASVALGLVGSMGFLMAFVYFLVAPLRRVYSGKPINYILFTISILILGMTMVATVGGFASIVSLLITPMVRGWNRISVFIAFLALVFFAYSVNDGLKALRVHKFGRIINGAFIVILIGLCLWDQTPASCRTCVREVKESYKKDVAFFQAIEAQLPPQSAVYQLPYVTYPEHVVEKMDPYGHARGFLASKTLRWSYGTMILREGDWFYRLLANEPLADQVAVVRYLGYSGIYLDRLGYCDRGNGTQTEIQTLLNLTAPTLEHPRGELLFFKFPNEQMSLQDKQYAVQVLSRMGYAYESGQLTMINRPWTVIDMRTKELPIDVLTITGISGAITAFEEDNPYPRLIPSVFEPHMPQDKSCNKLDEIENKKEKALIKEGRWSNALQAKTVTLWLARPIVGAFDLEITARAADFNVGKPLRIRVGNQERTIVLQKNISTQSIHFDAIDEPQKSKMIEMIPYKSSIPLAHDPLAIEAQKIAFELVSLQIKTQLK